ncbi:MAG TPA: hypothetical protein VKY59_02855 [Spirillospora sp.]|nr:hypothetical protein [Spirillospora sp.]
MHDRGSVDYFANTITNLHAIARYGVAIRVVTRDALARSREVPGVRRLYRSD